MSNSDTQREALIRAGISLAALQELGFESPPSSTLVSKLGRNPT